MEGSNQFDNQYMRRALELAKIAAAEGDVPVGAVVVDAKSKLIIGEGYNLANVLKDPTMHAEIIAIKEACKNANEKILDRCCIYVTLEPCAMCATAISYAQIAKLYYGAQDTKFGAVESNICIYNSSLSLHAPEVYGGILADESSDLLKVFFRDKVRKP